MSAFRRLLAELNTAGIGGKLTLGFGVQIVITLLLATLVLLAARQTSSEIDVVETVRSPASLTSATAQASLLRMQLHIRGYLVLSDLQDIERYYVYKREFEKSLAELQRMSQHWTSSADAGQVAELTEKYRSWAALPQPLFDLHDNTLRNRPAVRLARLEIQPRRVMVLDHLDNIIRIQQSRALTQENRQLLADLSNFQTAFDAMITSMLAYATSGELSFKLAYGPQLATTATTWKALSAKQHLLEEEQKRRFLEVARIRAEIADLALRIINVVTGDRAYEDLYLYRTEVAPAAEEMLSLLSDLTARQQSQLQSDIERVRETLSEMNLAIAVGGALAVLLGVSIGYLLRRQIVGPVRRLTLVAEQVAGGALTARATVDSQDEIGRLGRTLNAMTERLGETISHLEGAYDEAKRARHAAEVANRAKSDFLANMSHELRTPLNAILGYSQVLRRSRQMSDSQVASLGVIQRSGEHLLMLINDILDLAKIEAGKFELYRRPVNLLAHLQTIGDIIRVRAEQKDLRFECDIPPDMPPSVLADERRLRQVLLNLLGNAVKFTDRGMVGLAVRCEDASDGTVRIRFEVRDTGIGIPPDRLEAIFLPFEQVGDSARRTGGTGLGLSISRQLVRLMGGDIAVQSETGRGSLFSFALDFTVAPALEPAKPREHMPVGYRGARLRTLIVDDIEQNRAVLDEMLRPLGFLVEQAENGQRALERARTIHPDLILIDSFMPVMDGPEATRQLRADADLASVPIIAVSASAANTDRANTLAAGADAFISKPIDLNLLLETIGDLLKVDWVYGVDEAEVPAGGTLPRGIALPTALQARLVRAVTQLDVASVESAIEDVRAYDAPLAHALTQLAADYQYDAILRIMTDQEKTASGGDRP